MGTGVRLHWFWRGAIAVVAALGMAEAIYRGMIPGYGRLILWTSRLLGQVASLPQVVTMPQVATIA
jgi:hypothetical protein